LRSLRCIARGSDPGLDGLTQCAFTLRASMRVNAEFEHMGNVGLFCTHTARADAGKIEHCIFDASKRVDAGEDCVGSNVYVRRFRFILTFISVHRSCKKQYGSGQDRNVDGPVWADTPITIQFDAKIDLFYSLTIFEGIVVKAYCNCWPSSIHEIQISL
jgi:hypothetical protein